MNGFVHFACLFGSVHNVRSRLFLAKVAESVVNLIVQGLEVGDQGRFTIVGILELHTRKLVDRAAHGRSDLIPRHFVVRARVLHSLLCQRVKQHDVAKHPDGLEERAHLVVGCETWNGMEREE